MYQHDPWPGSTPGTRGPKLTRDPLGTEGELTAGPDELRPSVPQERRELEDMGFLPRADERERDDALTPLTGFAPSDEIQDQAEDTREDITQFSIFPIL
jgi:hypothetical protein